MNIYYVTEDNSFFILLFANILVFYSKVNIYFQLLEIFIEQNWFLFFISQLLIVTADSTDIFPCIQNLLKVKKNALEHRSQTLL